MTVENLILIKGGAYNDIKKALRQWIDLYSSDIPDNLTFQLFKNGRGNHIIKADKRLDNERFYYLVNYLNYPEEIEYKIDIEGFTIGQEENKLKGKNLLVYISPTDKDGDNVFITTSENENYKFDFGGKITEANEKRIFRLPTDLAFGHPELLTVNRKSRTNEKEDANKDSVNARFKIISLIALGLLFVSILVAFYDKSIFIKFTFFLGMGLGLWFFGDYKMLQSDKHYSYSLLISLAFLGYTTLVNQGLNSNLDIVDFGALYPLTLLIIQKPTRFIYKLLLKREPVIDRPPPTFWDGVYMLILFLSFAVLPFIVMDNLK